MIRIKKRMKGLEKWIVLSLFPHFPI